MPLPTSPVAVTATASASAPRAAHRPLTLVGALALWLAGPGNLPLWLAVLALGDSPGQTAVLLVGLGLIVFGAVAALLSLLVWPRLLRPLASVLLLVTAFNSYFMWQYGVVIDTSMLANVLHTDLREATDLFSPTLLATVLLLAGPPLWWLWHRPLALRRFAPQLARNLGGALAGLLIAVAMVLLSYQALASTMRNHQQLRFMINPLNSVYAGGWLLADQLPRQTRRLLPVGEDAALGASYAAQARPPLLLLVVGETARAQNWGLNGYARNTTPALQKWQQRGGLLNFGQATSCGTNTQVSVPCMFSPLTREQGGDETPDRENLLDVLQRAGLAVLWIDNQSGCKGVCDRVPHLITREQPVAGLCEDGECFDEVMLHNLDQRIAALDPVRAARGVVLVMHQMGSHGPAYFKRSPPQHKPYLPECSSATLADCEPQQLFNAYDNSIAYTDRVLDQALVWLKGRADQGRFDTGLIYASDHGESLGENGLYLHGVPYAFAPEQQTRVPMVAWFSPGLQQREQLKLDCLRARSATPLSHDNLFHTVLGLMDVNTRAYEPALDLVAPCAGVKALPSPAG